MKELLLTLWQLPQCIIGWIMLLFCPSSGYDTEYNGIKVRYSQSMSGGISLGRYIILADHYRYETSGNTVKHEYGHTRQSLYLGWLYLIVIGLPSLLWATFYNGDHRGYYDFWTESWADKLGGVERP